MHGCEGRNRVQGQKRTGVGVHFPDWKNQIRPLLSFLQNSLFQCLGSPFLPRPVDPADIVAVGIACVCQEQLAHRAGAQAMEAPEREL